jgi:hypothetical protein
MCNILTVLHRLLVLSRFYFTATSYYNYYYYKVHEIQLR